ncbi:MAG: VanW family protein [Bacillota bacterium]
MTSRTVPRPTQRSPLRMALGSVYFTLRRWVQWSFSQTDWARTIADPTTFGQVLFEHRTPLYRRLRNVDMWLQENKVTNLRIALRRLNGVVIKPGQTFSYWRLLGSPSARNGYLPGLALHNGQLRQEVAGGLCQLSNLIYWMALHSPLTVVERWRHNYDVFPDADRKLPFGSGATCFYNYVDLQLKNETDQPIGLHLYLTDQELVGELRSDQPAPYRYEVYEAAHEIRHEPWGGYTRHNLLRRRVYTPDGEQVDDQFVTENHAIMMYEPLLPTPGTHA